MVPSGHPEYHHEYNGKTLILSHLAKTILSFRVQIRHLQSLLALRLRTRLTRYLHDLYLSSNPDLRYYRASNYLDGVDQFLTSDVEAWANAFSGI